MSVIATKRYPDDKRIYIVAEHVLSMTKITAEAIEVDLEHVGKVKVHTTMERFIACIKSSERSHTIRDV